MEDVHLGRGRKGIENRKLIEPAWYALRMMKHNGLRPWNCIQQYVEDHNHGEFKESLEYKTLAWRFQCIGEQISNTESLARDYLQHHVALLGIEDSRAYIRQSKVSLEESRRTKLITVLAIFFVPVSLSTSVFGMNIHELNDSGQSLWVFILTTIVVVVATMTIWGLMYQFQKYNSLLRDDYPERKPWDTKLYHLFQLVRHGHTIWAWQSGMLLSLLTDGQVGFLRSCTSDDDDASPPHRSFHSARRPVEYISTHLKYGRGFECSKIEDQVE
ncbi:hypothetical protein F5Y14DRAFT_413780 [Nemania sp. NC0429]|nr:hypothetical protein F5Y14DRAFT_413780 [Nemania sp. NC0429]